MSEHVNLHPAIDGRNGAACDVEIDSQRDPLEELAAEFAERLRQNGRPSIERFTNGTSTWRLSINPVSLTRWPVFASTDARKIFVDRSAPAASATVSTGNSRSATSPSTRPIIAVIRWVAPALSRGSPAFKSKADAGSTGLIKLL